MTKKQLKQLVKYINQLCGKNRIEHYKGTRTLHKYADNLTAGELGLYLHGYILGYTKCIAGILESELKT